MTVIELLDKLIEDRKSDAELFPRLVEIRTAYAKEQEAHTKADEAQAAIASKHGETVAKFLKIKAAIDDAIPGESPVAVPEPKPNPHSGASRIITPEPRERAVGIEQSKRRLRF